MGNIRGRLKQDFQTASTASGWYEMDSEGLGKRTSLQNLLKYAMVTYGFNQKDE
ncbi:hypothetical protein [Neisseria animaloris]|uniref:hypothetical protein n=1 Tax=Neisseria animaloris TaxID=326522 RepID=UPI00131B6D03|nr:hypothetical protein [Neisseria animaloris]